MATTEPTQSKTDERIAREHLGSQTLFIGVDGEDAAHYWNYYTRTVAVVENDDADLFELAETPCATLAEWCEHVRDKRGWDVGPHVGGSLVSDLRQGLTR